MISDYLLTYLYHYAILCAKKSFITKMQFISLYNEK